MSVVAPVTPRVPPKVVFPSTFSVLSKSTAPTAFKVELSVVAPSTVSVPQVRVLPSTSMVNLSTPVFLSLTSLDALASAVGVMSMSRPMNVTALLFHVLLILRSVPAPTVVPRASLPVTSSSSSTLTLPVVFTISC